MDSPWLSLLCPSCRPNDLKRWLWTLFQHCDNPAGIELSLTVETPLEAVHRANWGADVISVVHHGEFSINQLTEMCYKQSTAPYTFLSGDDTLCHTPHWDSIFKSELSKYPDDVVLVYPNDRIFGAKLACYPVTSRLVMDSVPWPVPYQRYAIDDTIMDIVPVDRRVYLPDVIMEHLHLRKEPPGHKIVRDGEVLYYPHDVEAMTRDRELYLGLAPERAAIRQQLSLKMRAYA